MKAEDTVRNKFEPAEAQAEITWGIAQQEARKEVGEEILFTIEMAADYTEMEANLKHIGESLKKGD